MSDATWHDRLARRQAEFWAQVARLEQQQAARLDWRKPARTPSGLTKAVTEALLDGQQLAGVGVPPARLVDHSRAKTEKHDMGALVEESEAEYRPTPVVPDPRKDP